MFSQVFMRSTAWRLNSTVCRRHFRILAILPPFAAKCVFLPCLSFGVHSMHTDWESNLTEAVIGAAFEVANVLGGGFLEKVSAWFCSATFKSLRWNGRGSSWFSSFGARIHTQILSRDFT